MPRVVTSSVFVFWDRLSDLRSSVFVPSLL